MPKKILVLLILIGFTMISCKKNEYVENEFNELGQIISKKVFDKNKNPIKTIKYYDRLENTEIKIIIHKADYDSVFVKYDNALIFKRGKQTKNGNPYGIWNLYDKNENLREIREWFVIKNQSRINRVWYLNEKGDTLSKRYQDKVFNQIEYINDTIGARFTTYNQFIFKKDTISLNETLIAFANCGSPTIRDYDSEIKVFLARENNNYNFDFSNDNQVKLDTFLNLKFDSINQKWFETDDYGNIAIFHRKFNTSGEKILRGFMREYFYGPFKNNEFDSLIGPTIYFEKKIFVKDTI